MITHVNYEVMFHSVFLLSDFLGELYEQTYFNIMHRIYMPRQIVQVLRLQFWELKKRVWTNPAGAREIETHVLASPLLYLSSAWLVMLTVFYKCLAIKCENQPYNSSLYLFALLLPHLYGLIVIYPMPKRATYFSAQHPIDLNHLNFLPLVSYLNSILT